jgi:hypothetical protein
MEWNRVMDVTNQLWVLPLLTNMMIEQWLLLYRIAQKSRYKKTIEHLYYDSSKEVDFFLSMRETFLETPFGKCHFSSRQKILSFFMDKKKSNIFNNGSFESCLYGYNTWTCLYHWQENQILCLSCNGNIYVFAS